MDYDTIITIISIITIIMDVLLFALGIAVCFSIISIKNAINDIADVYCKLNKAQYRAIKEQEEKEKGL